jgi:uncharacterized membrane protein YozB (DUF420 family)
MYFAANIRGVYPIVAATHPVVALVLFALALWTVWRARSIGVVQQAHLRHAG